MWGSNVSHTYLAKIHFLGSWHKFFGKVDVLYLTQLVYGYLPTLQDFCNLNSMKIGDTRIHSSNKVRVCLCGGGGGGVGGG